ncbi:MAG: protein kinase [Chthoniobacter sp.]|uniref:protein kinase domain-containing protein n=1 Tax=Chthoniobacter sp. TaxID=2510640 RepID=UPI0032A51C2F
MSDTAVFDHYEVLTRDDGSLFELGRGAMGITYKAFDTSLRMPVALKVINATYLNSEVARQRFVREARSAAQLRNRHVASVFHLGTEGDTWFYAMEFIDGETLDALIKRQGPLAPVLALTITAQVARALNAAAQHSLVHRDIKPANLMLVKEDDELVAKVIDFGLAKASVVPEGEDAATLSMGGFVGTPHFASPEQLEEKELDSRSDIYSLGVTLWYMLAGQAPFAGSMAQVMSQHLSKPPPFERLDKTPPAVADVLRLMLAKDPDDRYQTPAELRRGIETAIEKITSAGGAAPMTAEAVEHSEDFATLLEDSTVSSPYVGSFETNTTIANRYRVAQSCGETNAGRVFRAYDTQRKTEVRLIVLHPEALGDTMAMGALEREVDKLVPVKHPNLLGVLGFETVDRGSFLVLEWTEGFSVLELLKARRELGADEALKLLQQAAAGADEALRLGLNNLQFGLHQLQIHFLQLVERETLLRSPISTWPAFELKLYPLGATREFGASQTWAGGQTMVGGGAEKKVAADADARPQYVQALGAVTYEVLGGTLSPLALHGGGPAARYTPLSTLSEEGNEVLRRALDPARSFPSAGEFYAALSKLDGLQVRRHESKAPGSAAPVQKSTPPPVIPSVAPLAPQLQKKAPLILIGGFAAVLIAGAGLLFFLHSPKPKTKDSTDPTTQNPTDDPSKTGTNGQTGLIAADNPPATPVPSTPLPATPAPATPPPGPTRQDLLKSAVIAAEALEEKGDWSQSLDAWLKITKDYPESPVGKNHLETMLNHLRDRPSPITFEEFQGMRPQIFESAQMEILSAMLLIGDSLRIPEPKIAVQWFSKAAEKDDLVGLVQYGLMLKKGEGMNVPEPEKAVALFQKAADKGDPSGKFELGECYLHGTGVTADPEKGAELLHQAADAGDARSMAEMGFCYSHGLGVPKDFTIAVQWFSKASDKGNLDGTANLGILYMNGQGVAANPKKAVELFETGAKASNPFSMQLYAAALEEGRGVGRNILMATSWYRKAAKAGNRAAIDWCNQHQVIYKN